MLEVLKGRIQQFSVLVALLLQLLPFQEYFAPSFLLLFELILAFLLEGSEVVSDKLVSIYILFF